MVLRMRYGTMRHFADQKGLKRQQLSDFLRRTSSTAKPAVAEEFGCQPDQFEISEDSTDVEVGSKRSKRTHRQNAEAK